MLPLLTKICQIAEEIRIITQFDRIFYWRDFSDSNHVCVTALAAVAGTDRDLEATHIEIHSNERIQFSLDWSNIIRVLPGKLFSTFSQIFQLKSQESKNFVAAQAEQFVGLLKNASKQFYFMKPSEDLKAFICCWLGYTIYNIILHNQINEESVCPEYLFQKSLLHYELHIGKG